MRERICLGQAKHQHDDPNCIWLPHCVSNRKNMIKHVTYIALLLDHVQQLPAIPTAFVKRGQLNKIMPVSSNQRRFMQNSVASHCQQFILPPGHPCLCQCLREAASTKPQPIPTSSSSHDSRYSRNLGLLMHRFRTVNSHSQFVVSVIVAVLHGGKCWQHTTRKFFASFASLASFAWPEGKTCGTFGDLFFLEDRYRIDALRTYLSSYIALPNHEQVAWSSTVFFKTGSRETVILTCLIMGHLRFFLSYGMTVTLSLNGIEPLRY